MCAEGVQCVDSPPVLQLACDANKPILKGDSKPSNRRLDTCEAVLLKGSIAHVVTLEDTSIRFSEHTVMAPVFENLNYYLNLSHSWIVKRQLCQTPLNGGEAYPVRTWLSSWNRAIQIQKQKISTC